MDTVEVLDYINEPPGIYNTWNNKILGKLPFPLHSAGLVPSSKCTTLTLLGGFSTRNSKSSRRGLLKTVLNKSYQDEQNEQEDWTISRHSLFMARSDFAVIPNHSTCIAVLVTRRCCNITML